MLQARPHGTRFPGGLAVGLLGLGLLLYLGPTAAYASQLPIVVTATSENPSRPKRAEPGEEITVRVEGLTEVLPEIVGGCEGLILFLDDIGLAGQPGSCDRATSTVRFTFERTPEADRAWRLLLGAPRNLTRTVSVSVGPARGAPWPTRVRSFELAILPPAELAVFCGLTVAAAGLLILLGWRTALLRVRHADEEAGRRAPYSLARVQLAFWSFLVIAGYGFVWMITHRTDTVTGSVAMLVGISSGTTLGSAFLGSTKTSSNVSAGFLADLLSDGGGVSLERFQFLSWTILFGIIFCTETYSRFAMPEFGSTLVGLMGMSSGTYLGSKLAGPRRKAH